MEVKTAIKAMNSGKAPGTDSIHAEMLKVVLVRYQVLFDTDRYMNLFDTRYLRCTSNIHIEHSSQ